MRRIAISDIHGCYKTFQYLIQEIIQLKLEDKLYLLGDFIDRGPGSKQVIDLVLEMQNTGFQVECTLGNHEVMMMDARTDLKESRRWMLNGGLQTMDSFNVGNLSDIGEKYWAFFERYCFFECVVLYLIHCFGLLPFCNLDLFGLDLYYR